MTFDVMTPTILDPVGLIVRTISRLKSKSNLLTNCIT